MTRILSQYDFTKNGRHGQNDGLVFYLLASGVSVNSTSIVIEREGDSNIQTDPFPTLEDLELLIDNHDSRYDFTKNGRVNQNDGLVFYLLASGVSVNSTSIVIEREGDSTIQTDPFPTLEALELLLSN